MLFPQVPAGAEQFLTEGSPFSPEHVHAQGPGTVPVTALAFPGLQS